MQQHNQIIIALMPFFLLTNTCRTHQISHLFDLFLSIFFNLLLVLKFLTKELDWEDMAMNGGAKLTWGLSGLNFHFQIHSLM